MSQFTLDLTGYKDRVGARVEPGRYRVVVDDTEMDKSKAGNPMVNVWLRIIGGEHDGAVLTDRLTITDKALFRVVGFMQAIGLPTPKKRLQVDLRQFNGKMLDVDVEDGDPYNGRIKTEVRGYIRIPGTKPVTDVTDMADDLPEAEDPQEPAAPAEAKQNGTSAFDKATAAAPEEVDLETLDLG